MPHHTSTPIKLVTDRARYLPPRNPIDSELGIIDATTLILLQKMMADSYEHGRVVWKENKARCAMTGEAESNDLPCGPNSAQKKVESWLIDAGLLAPDDDDDDDESDDTESDDEQATPPASPSPSTPDSPYRLPWHRRLELVLPNNKGSAPKSVSEPALHGPSPRSPLSPVKLWSAVQRGASSMPKLRLKPEHAVPPPPVVTPPSHPVASPKRKKCRSLDSAPVAGTPSADPYDTLLATAFKRAAMLRTITTDDVEAILRRHRNPLPKSHPDASWYIPANEPPPALQRIPAPPKPKPRPHFDDPASYRWPPAPSPTTPTSTPILEPSSVACPESDARWYHVLLLVFLWHFLIVSFSAYVVLRLVFRPLVGVVVIYCAVLLVQVLRLSFIGIELV